MKADARARCSPLVSVVLLNYKRRDALERVLRTVLQQEYPEREIILVDNHSEDNVRAFIEEQDAGIRIIDLPENRGAGGGRNAGILEAKGDIVVTLDNDIGFSSPFELTKVVRTFEERPDIHTLALQVNDAETGELRLREWCHPRSWQEYGQSEFETHYFVEGACAMRREVYESAGLYYEPLFIYCEGYDLALRILNHGFRILYCPHIKTFHLMSPETRTPEKPYYYFTRNYFWIAYKDYPPWAGLQFLAPKLLMMFYFTLRSGRFRPFIRGVRDGVTGWKRIRNERTPVTPTTIRYLAELERLRPGWLFRLARHRTQPQL